MSVWIESGGAWPAGSYQLALEQPGWARECNFELPLEPTSDGRIAAAALGCTPALDLAVVAETSCGRPSNPVVGDCVPLPEHYRIEGLIREQLTGALSVRLERGGVTLVDESRPLVYTELRPNGPGCAPVCEGTNVEVMLPSE
jgi:hypothetical protein